MINNYNIKVKILLILITIIYIVYAVEVKQKEIPYTDLPENERPESLFSGRYEKNVECLRSVKLAESKNPALTQCYKSTELFYSPLTTVCSERCLEQTVIASNTVAQYCDTKDIVFKSWSNLENAKLFCSLDGKTFCIRKIKDFELIILQRQKIEKNNKIYEIPLKTKERLCKPCIKDIYTLFKGYLTNNTIIPRVYYDQLKNLENIVPEIEKVCNFY